MDLHAKVENRLNSILGLRLSIARNAGNMKNFQFGTIRPHPSGKGTVGDFALHVQCPWRIVTNDRIQTGSGDFYEPAEEDGELNENDPQSGNPQSKRLVEIFTTYDPQTRSLVNETNSLGVTAVHSDQFGGIDLELSGGLRLQVFPNGSRGEAWRFFSP